MTSKPIAVVISDVHYTLASLTVADKAFRMAIDKASELRVPLIDCGDLTNDKAILRAEIVNALLDTMNYAASKGVKVYCLVGNHSLLNEKGQDHALHFLKALSNTHVIDRVSTVEGFNFIPYQTDSVQFVHACESFPPGAIIFAHQGTTGGQLGHYVRDNSSFDPQRLQQYRIFLGHYHNGYELFNTVSIGTPYTTSFAEAEDTEKGFVIVYGKGTYKRVGTNLRRHRTIACDVTLQGITLQRPEDIIWVKLRGTRKELLTFDKTRLDKALGRADYQLDKIPTDDTLPKTTVARVPTEILDELLGDKQHLKDLWREIYDSNPS